MASDLIGKVIAGGYNIDLLEKNSSEVKEIMKTKKEWSKNTFFKINNNIFTSFTPVEKKIDYFKSTNKIKKDVLTKIGRVEYENEKKQIQIVRINGSAFISDDSYNSFEELMDVLKARVHTTIDEVLKIFLLVEFAGKGFPIWSANGQFLKEKIITCFKKKFNE